MAHMKMWRLVIFLVGAILVASIVSGAQEKCRCSDCKNDPSCSCCPGQVLKGTIKAQGEKYTFIIDNDKKVLEITNPEELKGGEGHHVQITGHVSADKNSVTVTSMKMLKGASKSKDQSKQ